MRNHLRKVVLTAIAVTACGPGRTSFARYPAAATAFDRAGSDPKALAIADRVIAAAGGAERWNQVKQLKWSEVYANNGKTVLSMDEAWDRWNGRHNTRLHKAGDATYDVEASHNPTQSVRSGEGDVVVMRKLYEEGGGAFFDSGHGLLPLNAPDVPRALATARERWQFDTAALCMSFLLEEPGAKLSYVGEVAAEDGKPPLDDIKVSLDPRDPNRTSTYHVMVNRDTNLIDRLEIVEAGQPDTRRIAFHLGQWTEVNGLKFPTVDDNAGIQGEVITFKDITTGEPDDALYVPQVQ
jgi:hypothetical protein